MYSEFQGVKGSVFLFVFLIKYFFFGCETHFSFAFCFYRKGQSFYWVYILVKHQSMMNSAALRRILYPKYVYCLNVHNFDLNFVSAVYISQIVYTHVDQFFCFCLTNSEDRRLLLGCILLLVLKPYLRLVVKCLEQECDLVSVTDCQVPFNIMS